MSKRIDWIDVAKGICMLAVIAGHLGVAAIDNVVFSFHLTVFFILSGYTLKKDISGGAVAKRFGRLMLPYFVTCAAVTVVDVINYIIINQDASTAKITQVVVNDLLRSFMASGSHNSFAGVGFNGRIGAIWFLPAIFFATVLTQLLLNHIQNKKIRYGVAIVLFLTAFVTADFFWLPFSLQSALFAVPFVMFGYDAREKGMFENLNLRHFLIALAVFVVGVILDLAPIYFVSADAPDVILTPVFALSSSVCVIYISKRLEFVKPLAFIGRNSLYYICIHLFEMETLSYWFKLALETLGLPLLPSLFILRVLFSTALTLAILSLKKLLAKNTVQIETTAGKRDVALDISKAILISLMLVGHFTVSPGLRNIIYSFHMAAFVLLSGYMFSEKACVSPWRTVLKLVKSFLIPYALFAVGYVIFTHNGIACELKTLLLGVSFTNNLFDGTLSIGPVYFILLLFCVRLVYLGIAVLVKGDVMRSAIVVALSLIGVCLGELGWWLPWSFDCALYALVFYHVGYLIKKYNILSYLCNRPQFYFALVALWSYSIHVGSMELSVRNYGKYGVVVIGATCATMLVYMLSAYLYRLGGKMLSFIGQNTLYILLVHTLFNSAIGDFVSSMLSLTPGYIYHLVMTVLLNLLIGTAVGMLVSLVKIKPRTI